MKCDVMNPRCPSREVLDRVADAWTALVLKALAAESPLRYGELQRRVGGVSQKMLTQTLRALERDGLVVREVFPEVPPRVEYRLTRLVRSLTEPLAALCRWAEAHIPEIRDARRRFDGASPRGVSAAARGRSAGAPSPAA